MTTPVALPAPPPVTNTAPVDQPSQIPQVPQAAQPPQQYAQPPQPVALPPAVQAPPATPAPASGGWATPPPPPPSWDTKTHIGATCLVVVHKCTPDVTTQFGIKKMVDVTIIELAGPTPGVIYEGEELYNVQLVGQLEGLVGQYTLGRFAFGQGKGNQPPIVLNPPTEQDTQMAQAWFTNNPSAMAELQRVGKLKADQPKPPPQQNQWQQPGPMQGQQWQNSPTQGGYPPPPQYGQNPYPQPNGQQPPPYPWQQPPNGAAQQNHGSSPQAGAYGSYPGQGQSDQPPF